MKHEVEMRLRVGGWVLGIRVLEVRAESSRVKIFGQDFFWKNGYL